MTYTLQMSKHIETRAQRKAFADMSYSPIVDALCGPLNVFFWPCQIGLLVAVGVMTAFSQKKRMLPKENRSTEEGGSITAIWTLRLRAVAAVCGFGPDKLALQLAWETSPVPSAPMMRWWMRASIVLGWIEYKLTRTLSEEAMAISMNRPFSSVAWMHLRTCWLDDVVETFAAQTQKQSQLVILGAGYDTRCYRLKVPATMQRFEVDAPGTQAEKLRKLKAISVDTSGVRFISCDFAAEDWLAKLEASGFDRELPTCFLWEGVTMYLSESAVLATLRAVRRCGPGSVIAFDYLRPAMIEMFGARMRRSKEAWQFALAGEEEAAALVRRAALEAEEHASPAALTLRYLPQRPGGRYIGVLADTVCGHLLAKRPE